VLYLDQIIISGEIMPILIKDIINTYLEKLNQVLRTPEKLDEAAVYRNMTAEVPWKNQFTKDPDNKKPGVILIAKESAKPEATLTNLEKYGWLNNDGSLAKKFEYHPSETKANGNRYDDERKEFHLTQMNTKEQIALASAYFKAAQDTFNALEGNLAPKDAKALQDNLLIIRRLVSQELASEKIFAREKALDLTPDFQKKLTALNPENIAASFKLTTAKLELIAYLENIQQKNITKYTKQKNTKKTSFSVHFKSVIDEYKNGTITLTTLKETFAAGLAALTGSKSSHKLFNFTKESLNKIEDFETQFYSGAKPRSASPSAELTEVKGFTTPTTTPSSSDSDDMTSSDDEEYLYSKPVTASYKSIGTGPSSPTLFGQTKTMDSTPTNTAEAGNSNDKWAHKISKPPGRSQ
jgi:hypothetical protein